MHFHQPYPCWIYTAILSPFLVHDIQTQGMQWRADRRSSYYKLQGPQHLQSGIFPNPKRGASSMGKLRTLCASSSRRLASCSTSGTGGLRKCRSPAGGAGMSEWKLTFVCWAGAPTSPSAVDLAVTFRSRRSPPSETAVRSDSQCRERKIGRAHV